MPSQKYLGQHITNELGIFLLLCHSHTQKLQHSGRNKKQEDTTELSRSPLLEAAAVTELPMPAGTANPNHLLKCDHKHKAAPVWLWLLRITKIKLLTASLRGQFLSKGNIGYTFANNILVHLPWKAPCVTAMVLKALQVADFPLFSPCRTPCGTHRPCRHHQCSVICCWSRCARSSAQQKVLAGGTGGGGWCSTGGWGGAPGQGTGPSGHPGWSPRGAVSPSSTSMTPWWACSTPWWGWGNTRAPTASYQVRTQPSAPWRGADF